MVANCTVSAEVAPKATALRKGLPYGAVMATAGASALARACGLGPLVRPLLWLAVAEAAWILGVGVHRHRAELHLPVTAWLRVGPPAEHAGVLTVPLGLAVLATGLASQPGGVASAVGVACLVLAWLTTVVLVLRFVASLRDRRWPRSVDGAWFLPPAALLAAGIAAAAYLPRDTGVAEVLRWSSLVTALLGTGAYWAVAAVAARRMVCHGLEGSRPVLWTISAGCGGLAAAALGRALFAGATTWSPGLTAVMRVAAAATCAAAAVLAIPILITSARWLTGLRHVSQAPPWPPTFSTAVFALGVLAVGNMFHQSSVTTAGKVCGYATVAFWVVTAAPYVHRILARRPLGHSERSAPG